MWMIPYFTSLDQRNPAPVEIYEWYMKKVCKNEIFSMSAWCNRQISRPYFTFCRSSLTEDFPFVNFRQVFQQPSHVLQVATYEQTCIWCKCPVAKLFGIDPGPMRRQNLLNSSLSWIFMFAKQEFFHPKSPFLNYLCGVSVRSWHYDVSGRWNHGSSVFIISNHAQRHDRSISNNIMDQYPICFLKVGTIIEEILVPLRWYP